MASSIPARNIRLKRAYEAPSRDDGPRVLVDRLWPRGISKQKAALDQWMKGVAPSTELREWFGHDPARWAEFQKRTPRNCVRTARASRSSAHSRAAGQAHSDICGPGRAAQPCGRAAQRVARAMSGALPVSLRTEVCDLGPDEAFADLLKKQKATCRTEGGFGKPGWKLESTFRSCARLRLCRSARFDSFPDRKAEMVIKLSSLIANRQKARQRGTPPLRSPLNPC